MVILVGLYNAEKYISKCINSIKRQTYRDYKCYITHDMSTDMSVEVIRELIKNDDRFILVDDYDKKYYQAGNFDRVLRYNELIDDNEVVIEVDGDDYLPDDGVFTRINELYLDSNVWIANGNFKYITGELGFSSPQTDFDNIRQSRFTASHIRTWRVFLWRAISESDLKDENGDYWQWSGDLCFMFPMLEMSGPEHYRFMHEINYVYNSNNPINEHKVDMSMVNDHANRIRSKNKYDRLLK